MIPLQCLNSGEWAEIAELYGEPAWLGRMAELGIRAGSRIQVVQPGSPCLLQLNGSRISLRTDDSMQILVQPVHPAPKCR